MPLATDRPTLAVVGPSFVYFIVPMNRSLRQATLNCITNYDWPIVVCHNLYGCLGNSNNISVRFLQQGDNIDNLIVASPYVQKNSDFA